ncbi:MAG: electron transport complex subunit RsxC [Clostridia bacterium]|nr:electron transport complex subunit RsxC [Clostridia bacterium]
MFRFKFLGKTHVPHRKNTASMTPVKVAPPDEVFLPLLQHIGAPATPIVKVGDEVKVGQLIAEASGELSSPVYASVSGKVTKIDSCMLSGGKTVAAIRIASDGLMQISETVAAPQLTDFDSFIDAVRNSGVVGLGGAGFPTAVKLSAAKNTSIDTIILNGAECEPYITSDARTMVDNADSVRDGVELLKQFMPDVQKYIIAIEENKPECIEKMKDVFSSDENVSVVVLPSLYPQGAEKVLIRNVTGITVPAGKLPADVGVLVINVTSVAKIAEYVKTGMPLVERCITVDGSAISEPKNLIVAIGSSIKSVLDAAGGVSEEPGKVVLGGPMTGNAVCSLDEPVIKTTGAVLAFTKKDSVHQKTTACIHCGRCVDACPHLLNPTAFTKSLSIENEEERMQTLDNLGVTLCVECGCCSYVCPANRPLMENNRVAKNALRSYKAAKKDLK